MSATEGDSGSSKLTFAAKGTYLIWRAPVRPIPLDSNLKVGAATTEKENCSHVLPQLCFILKGIFYVRTGQYKQVQC